MLLLRHASAGERWASPALDHERALLETLPAGSLVCTHREVIERLFDGEVQCEKGGTWVLEHRRRRWRPAEYLPPPGNRTWQALVGAARGS